MGRAFPEADVSQNFAAPRQAPSYADRPTGWQVVAVDRQSILIGVVRSGDLLATTAGAVAAYLFRYGTAEMAVEYWMFTLLGGLLLVNYLQIALSYEFDALRSLRTQTAAIFGSWSAVIISLISLAYFIKLSHEFSRTWMVIWFCTTAVLLVMIRVAGALLIKRWQRSGRLAHRVAIIGARELVDKIGRRLGSTDGIEIVTRLIFHRREVDDETRPLSGNVANLLALARSGQIDEIIVAPRSLPDSHLHNLIRTLRTLAIDVRLYATGLEQPLPSGTLKIVFGMPLLSIVERPLTGWTRIAKRCEDIVISSMGLLFLLPLMCLLALAIKLDSPGPVIFRQNRYGFNNNLIGIYKFRSMHHHRATLEHSAEQARRNDVRVTRVGRLLRRTSLDELPQLFNVLKGDMSLVGPRPHPVMLNEKFADVIDGYLARHRVKPGITGWAQVNGLRGETDTLDKMQRRVEHDLHYIDNWSFLLDLRIIFLTVFVGFVHENAY